MLSHAENGARERCYCTRGDQARDASILLHSHDIVRRCLKECRGGGGYERCRYRHTVQSDRSDCNNYRETATQSIVGKMLPHIVLARLRLLDDHEHPESQCGFRHRRSQIDTIISVKRIWENVGRSDNLCALHLSTSHRPSSLSAAADFSVSYRRCTVLLSCSAYSSQFTPIWRALVATTTVHQRLIQSSGELNRYMYLSQPYFWIFFALLMSHVFLPSTDGIYFHTGHNTTFRAWHVGVPRRITPMVCSERCCWWCSSC